MLRSYEMGLQGGYGASKNYDGMHFRERGYFVTTVGTDEEVGRAYIKEQEKEDQRIE